jgi:hypothetical protein
VVISPADGHDFVWLGLPVDGAGGPARSFGTLLAMPTPPVPPRVHGPLDRRGALAAGITDWHLRHADVLRSSRDTYLPRFSDELQRIGAVLLGAPDGAVVSHLTAARLWGFEVPLVPEDQPVHLTVGRSVRRRHRRDRRLHFSDVPRPGTPRRHGVVTTSPGRTWMDLAAVVPPAALLAVTDQMLARGSPRDEFSAILRRSVAPVRCWRPSGPHSG